jgi:hypothetical protein
LSPQRESGNGNRLPEMRLFEAVGVKPEFLGHFGKLRCGFRVLDGPGQPVGPVGLFSVMVGLGHLAPLQVSIDDAEKVRSLPNMKISPSLEHSAFSRLSMRLRTIRERGMKRFLIFLLLGPALGLAVFVLRDIAGGRIFGGAVGFLVGLPFAYVFGLPIVLVMWAEDWWMWRRIPIWAKVVTSAVTGYAASVAMLLALTSRPLSVHEVLTFGIVGAVPAAVCSLLAQQLESAPA